MRKLWKRKNLQGCLRFLRHLGLMFWLQSVSLLDLVYLAQQRCLTKVFTQWWIVGIRFYFCLVTVVQDKRALISRVAFKEISELNTEKLPIFKFLHESRHSEILVIFAEDLCAIIGLLLALLGTVLTMVTGNPVFDAISGLLIGFLLMAAAIFLTREFYSLIVGERVTDSDLEKILIAFERPEVERVINVKTVHLGPTEILIAAKIDLVSQLVLEDYEIINQIEAEIRKKISDKKCYIYIEIDEFVQGYVQSSDL